MQLSQNSLSIIERAIREMAKKCAAGEEKEAKVTDLYFQPRQDTGELIIFDDDDRELSHIVVSEWEGYGNEDFYSGAEEVLSKSLAKLQKEGVFDHLAVQKPCFVVMVDEDKETIVDLQIFDDETVILNDSLLEGLDQEMDDFLTHLLKD